MDINLQKNSVIFLPSWVHNKVGGNMPHRILKFFKCKTCHEINKDYKWNHSEIVKMDASSVTRREKIYCPNCVHTEYEEIEYEDLPYSFKYLMNKQNIRDSLESLEKDCKSKHDFLMIMESLGWKK